ncbi:hypothetical protein [Eggerthella sp. YY7918]|uniref:hypothetical protein n=1 Tax=Eggerthella sp. (strain YY7918) TaxID=502558 RepID=UPI0005A26F7C|nr:hypothetical protein [Eggerthella sp. YY7918]
MTDNKHRPPEPPPVPQNAGFTDHESKETGMQLSDEPQKPETPSGFPPPSPNANDARELRSAQNFILAASIAGPISLILMSTLISIVGVVAAYIGFRKLRMLSEKHSDIAAAAARMKRPATFALVICSVAVVLNVIIVLYLLPTFMQAVESGDYGSMLSGGQNLAPETNSTWG